MQGAFGRAASQSVATRLVVEARAQADGVRRRGLLGHRRTFAPGAVRRAALVSVDGTRVRARAATSAPTARSRRRDQARTSRPRRALADALKESQFAFVPSSRSRTSRKPAPPFMTLDAANRKRAAKLRFTSQTTMRVAQRLYEETGTSPNMRTDSTDADRTLRSERGACPGREKLYGAITSQRRPPVPSARSRNAQEAHEAIRPAGDRFRLPREVQG